jgi:predicted phage-related endonuclease
VATVENALNLPQQLINSIAYILKEEAQRKKELEEMKVRLKNAMLENGIKSWNAGLSTATIAQDSISNTFDTTKFKAEHPDLYEQYIKQSVRAGAFTLKLK